MTIAIVLGIIAVIATLFLVLLHVRPGKSRSASARYRLSSPD
jgi:hypothetical protein